MAWVPPGGGLFPGDPNLSPTFSKGTFVASPVSTDPAFYRTFAANSSEILIITTNGKYFLRGSYPTLRTLINARDSSFAANYNGVISVNVAVSSTNINVLSRSGSPEDLWISLTPGHTPSLIIWGEDGFGGTHADVKNNNGGLRVYVRP